MTHVVTSAEIERCARLLADSASSPARVMMFGSCARGRADEHRDLDFLVIEQHVESRASESVRLRDALPPLDVSVDVIVYSQEQAARRALVKGSIVATTPGEGRVLAQS